MPVESETKQHVHELVEQLGAAQIAAVLHLLEVMVESEEEPLIEEDSQAVAASREYFVQNPGGGLSFEEFAADCGSPWIRFPGAKTEAPGRAMSKKIRF
jgi:hypothetical protein